ncbi:MAG: DoxX family protein [Myxococcota bacterium]|nr:DoxX family protein [Myxococcota bacterium]
MTTYLLKLIDAGPDRDLLTDSALLIVRLVFGLSMAFAHGLGKVPPSDGFIGFVGSLGFPAPVFFAWAAGLAEFVGGIFIAAGLLTRVSGFFLLQTMLVAVFMAHGDDPFGKMEMGILYATVSLALMGTGAGRLSLDRLLSLRLR